MWKPKQHPHWEVHFRQGHYFEDGRCTNCGVSIHDLRRWPSLQCNPECCPSANKLWWRTAEGARVDVLYDSGLVGLHGRMPQVVLVPKMAELAEGTL